MNSKFLPVKPTRYIQSGFTLIEVMVALAVVSIALPAMLTLVMSQLDGTASIREKTIAFWVAENEMTRVRIQHAQFPSVKLLEETKGTVVMGDMQWYWEMKSEETKSALKDFYRIDMAVYSGGVMTEKSSTKSASSTARKNRDKKEPMAHLAGFLSD